MGPEEIGARLRRERQARGWDVPDMARELRAHGHTSEHDSLVRQVRHWEKTGSVGEKNRLLYVAAFKLPYDDLFGADAEMLTPDDRERVQLAIARPARIDRGVVDALALVLAGQRRAEDVVGSALVIAPVAGQLATIEQLAREARGPVRTPLIDVAAQWAQFAGWLYAHTGQLATGETLMRRAIEWAVEADDPDLISETTSCLGNVAWLSGNVGATIGLSQAAIRHGRFPGQIAISSVQEARGHAAEGELTDAERLLDQAEEYAERERARLDEAPPWLYYHVPGFYDLQRGHVLRLAGRTDPAYNDKAIVALSTGRARLPQDMQRSEWAGDFLYQLGRAHDQAGQRERAEELERELSGLAAELDSELLADRAADLRRGLP